MPTAFFLRPMFVDTELRCLTDHNVSNSASCANHQKYQVARYRRGGPHRGISQEKRSLYLGFFELACKVRKRGKALLGPLIDFFEQAIPGEIQYERACYLGYSF